MQTIQAEEVYEHDEFYYELGLNPKLIHKPVLKERGDLKCFYAVFRLTNGGYGFKVMSKEDIDAHAKEYSKAFGSTYSPWTSNYIEMSKKTIIKKLLKLAPVKTSFQRALSTDETIKTQLDADMTEVQGENIFDVAYQEE